MIQLENRHKTPDDKSQFLYGNESVHLMVVNEGESTCTDRSGVSAWEPIEATIIIMVRPSMDCVDSIWSVWVLHTNK